MTASGRRAAGRRLHSDGRERPIPACRIAQKQTVACRRNVTPELSSAVENALQAQTDPGYEFDQRIAW